MSGALPSHSFKSPATALSAVSLAESSPCRNGTEAVHHVPGGKRLQKPRERGHAQLLTLLGPVQHMHAKSLQSCPALCDPMDHSLPGSSVHGILSGKNTGMGCHAPLQGIFLTQRSNPCLLCFLYWQAGSLPLVPPATTNFLEYLPLNLELP